MTTENFQLRSDMMEITYKYGHAAAVLELAAAVGWQGRYASSCHEKQIAKVAQMLAEAAEILALVESQQAESNEGIEEAKKAKRKKEKV